MQLRVEQRIERFEQRMEQRIERCENPEGDVSAELKRFRRATGLRDVAV